MSAPRLPIAAISGADEATLRRLRSDIQHAAWVMHDPALLEASFAATGCACCRAGASMTASLLDLFRKRTQAEVPPFERIIVTAAAGQAGDALIELNRSAFGWMVAGQFRPGPVPAGDALLHRISSALVGADRLRARSGRAAQWRDRWACGPDRDAGTTPCTRSLCSDGLAGLTRPHLPEAGRARP